MLNQQHVHKYKNIFSNPFAASVYRLHHVPILSVIKSFLQGLFFFECWGEGGGENLFSERRL